jgi:hypothetical protein
MELSRPIHVHTHQCSSPDEIDQSSPSDQALIEMLFGVGSEMFLQLPKCWIVRVLCSNGVLIGSPGGNEW